MQNATSVAQSGHRTAKPGIRHARGTQAGMTREKVTTLTELIDNPNIALLTLPEVSAILRKERRVIGKMVDAGDIPAKKLAGSSYVTRGAILDLLDPRDIAHA